jgi:hypothetical protein
VPLFLLSQASVMTFPEARQTSPLGEETPFFGTFS